IAFVSLKTLKAPPTMKIKKTIGALATIPLWIASKISINPAGLDPITSYEPSTTYVCPLSLVTRSYSPAGMKYVAKAIMIMTQNKITNGCGDSNFFFSVLDSLDKIVIYCIHILILIKGFQ